MPRFASECPESLELHSSTTIPTVVCIKVPPTTASERDRRNEYDACENREEWLQHLLGPDGVYVARPKNDGGWFTSPTVKAGSMFANPFPVGLGEGKFSDDESMRRFREYVIVRASPTATATCRCTACASGTARPSRSSR